MNLEHYSPAPDLPPTDLRGPADRGGGASPVRGSTEPFTALGLASEFVPDQEEQGLDPAAAPTLDEVLAARSRQGAELERWLSTVAEGQLLAPAPVPAGGGWPPYARGKSILECVRVVLGEEWAHHGFCARDLRLLGG